MKSMKPTSKLSSAMMQKGFSLIEVLVTMVILAFGLLGVAGLLVGGVSNAAGSEAFSKASQLAADMADRIRANPAAALSASSEYNLAYTDSIPSAPATIALSDKKVWMEALAAQLPQGKGRIVSTVGGGQRQYDIYVRWSNCLGTLLSDAALTACETNSSASFRELRLELRL